MVALTMPVCIFTLLSLFLLLLLSTSSYIAGSAYTLTLISTIRTIASSVRTVTEYIISVILLILGLVTSFILIVLFCHIMQNLLGSIPSGHFILQYLEKRVKVQLRALHLEEKKASRLIQEHLEAIDQWDEANAQLMTEIRAAEAIIKNKGWDWNTAPDRDRRSKTLGSTFFIHGPWSPRPREQPEPSAWYLVRWLRNEDDPRVWAAKAKVTHENGVLSDKRAVLARLQGENEDLFAKRDETIRKRNAVQWGPRQPKATTDTWAARQLSLLNRSAVPCQPVPYQPAPAHIQTNPCRCDLDFTSERIHYCEFCGQNGHRWTNQYDSLVTARAAPYERPCPAFLARPKPRPFFVRPVPAGRPSFFDPDPVVDPQGLQCWPAPAPLPAAPTFSPPPAPLFSASPAPLFSAPPAPLAPAAAKASLFAASQVQTSVQSVLAPVTAPPPVPQTSHATALFTPSAAPIARSTTPPATPPPRPAAPAPSTTPPYTPPLRPAAPATPAAPVVKRAPAAPRGRGPPTALQIVWPGQTTAGPAASVAKDAAKEKAAREQEMAALVQQEAEERAAEKAMAKRQKKQTSAPQVEKKNYRF